MEGLKKLGHNYLLKKINKNYLAKKKNSRPEEVIQFTLILKKISFYDIYVNRYGAFLRQCHKSRKSGFHKSLYSGRFWALEMKQYIQDFLIFNSTSDSMTLA